MNQEFRAIRAVFYLLIFGLVAFAPKDAFAQNCGPGVRACIQGLDFLPGTSGPNRSSRATAISADGTTVVGTAKNADGIFEAFRWINGSTAGLGKLPVTGTCPNSGSCSEATGVSGDGAIVVGNAPTTSVPRGFRWSGGTMAPIMTTACSQPDSRSTADAISTDGSTIIGTVYCAGPNPTPYRSVNGSMSLLDYSAIPNATGASVAAVNANGSVIVGGVGKPNGDSIAVRWNSSGTLTALAGLPNAPNNSPTAVTPDGSIIFGSSNPNSGCCVAVRWNSDTDVRQFLGGTPSGASANGVTVSNYTRWTSRDGTHDFSQLLTAAGVDLSQWTSILTVKAVSADGMTFAGYGASVTGLDQAFIARLPLPAFHDFDGGGRSDIVWRNLAGDNAMWLMNGATISSVAGIINVPTNWYIVGQRDFNGDGKTDLLWASTTGDVAIWLMNGSSILSVTSLGNVGANWGVAATGDFDNDGKGDILWRNTTGDNAIWFMNGTTIASIAVLGNIPTNWVIAGSADFNGDGKSDILWRNAAGDNAIWLMNGATISSVAGLGNVPTNWSVVGTADFNADGKGDIMWRNSGGDNAIWLMNGGTIASVAGLGNIPTNWSVVSNGDYNGDGKGDILWRNSAGDNAIWFMNGATLSSLSVLGNVPTNWTIQNAGAN